MKKKIVAGNWKMNKNSDEAEELVAQLVVGLKNLDHNTDEIVLCPPAVFLQDVTKKISD